MRRAIQVRELRELGTDPIEVDDPTDFIDGVLDEIYRLHGEVLSGRLPVRVCIRIFASAAFKLGFDAGWEKAAELLRSRGT